MAQALDVPFGVVDLSLAPTPNVGDSVGEILKLLGEGQEGIAQKVSSCGLGECLSHGAERVGWKREMYKLGFDVLRDRELVGLEKHGNRLKAILRNEFTGDTQEHTVDQVVTDFGTLAVDEVYQQLRAGSANDGVKDIDCLITGKPQPVRAGNGSYELYRIGDASASRNVAAAVYDALRLCRTL